MAPAQQWPLKHQACPADQEMVTLPSGAACTAKCSAGKVRDSANPSQCKDVVCGPDERKNGNGECINVGAPPSCGPTANRILLIASDNTPSWSCFPEMRRRKHTQSWKLVLLHCRSERQTRRTGTNAALRSGCKHASSCGPGSRHKPRCGKATRFNASTGDTTKPPPVPPSTQCHVCDPSLPPELCEQASIEQTCTFPTTGA